MRKPLTTLYIFSLVAIANSAYTQHGLKFSLHYGPSPAYTSMQGFQEDFTPEYIFRSAPVFVTRLDYQFLNRLHLRGGYYNQKTELQLHFPYTENTAGDIPDYKEWEMKYSGLEISAGVNLVKKEKFSWLLYAAYTMQLSAKETELRVNKQPSFFAPVSTDFTSANERVFYGISNELEVKIGTGIYASLEPGVRYSPAYINYKGTASDAYFFQALFGLKYAFFGK